MSVQSEHTPYMPPVVISQKLKSLVEERKAAEEAANRLITQPHQPYKREEPRIGRNDPCSCGSGKKYKKCHMLKDTGGK